MNESTIIVAIVTGLFTAVPCIISTLVTNNAREAVQTERMRNMALKIDEFNEKMDKLIDFDKRISLLEQSLDHLINDMKEVQHNEQ